MSVFPANFEHTFLTLIWLASLTLACASVLMAIALIGRHAVMERSLLQRGQRKAATAATMQTLLVSMRATNVVAPELLDMSLAIEIAIEWLRNLSGKQAEDIVSMLQTLGSEAFIAQNLAQGGKSARIKALIYCSHETTPRSLQHLVEHCDDPDQDIQIICLRGLAKRGAYHALADALGRIDLSKMKSTLVLADIFMKLGQDGNDFLIALMGNEQASTEIRMAVVIALGHNRALDAVAPLMALCRLRDVAVDIRSQAMNALGYIGDQRAEAVVLDGLDDAETSMRVNAIRAASRLKCISFVPKISALLDDPAWWVRFRAAQALGSFEGVGQIVLKEAIRAGGSKAKLVQTVMDEGVKDVS